MKKILKIIRKTICIIILIYVLFIFEESIRLSIKKSGEPLIVFEEKYINNGEDFIYKSLGFTYTTSYTCRSSDLCFLFSQEFWLFDKILMWAWTQ